jgi:hypothetical protein
MPRTFEQLLAELIKRSSLPNDPINKEFRDGDVEHLQRWLDFGDANKMWSEISGEPFYSGDAFRFVMLILYLRRAAEEADEIDKETPKLKRRTKKAAPKAHRRALKMLADEKITPEDYEALKQRIEKAARPLEFSDPLLSVRSNEGKTRRRTIFCRILSETLRDIYGKWHDAQVAELCEIALNCGDVTNDSVRHARRGLKP